MITISGGVISKESGTSVSYKLKCEKCGQINDSESTVTMTKGVTEISTKKCSFCGNVQMIKMKYSMN
ncbi:MAG: hypothetical protein EHM93_14680 [Bacteroidales bacterium]|nr:MAG: hypothetical protein EHM93_14680 [Bacteroidales bacterium]